MNSNYIIETIQGKLRVIVSLMKESKENELMVDILRHKGMAYWELLWALDIMDETSYQNGNEFFYHFNRN